MAIPVINTTTSILGFKQFEDWQYQPFATGLSTGTITWTAVGLPAGMAIDAGTGLIDGAATRAGVFIAGLNVNDSINGDAAPLALTIGIEPATGSLRSGADLFVDLQSGKVTLAGVVVPPTTDNKPVALFSVKEDDDLLIYVQFRRGETVVDLGAITEMNFGLKELETEEVTTIGGGVDTTVDGTPFKVGADETYILHVKFDGDKMAGALSNYEADTGTEFLALCELEWIEPNPTSGDRVGPATLRRTSQTFYVRVVRDLVE